MLSKKEWGAIVLIKPEAPGRNAPGLFRALIRACRGATGGQSCLPSRRIAPR